MPRDGVKDLLGLLAFAFTSVVSALKHGRVLQLELQLSPLLTGDRGPQNMSGAGAFRLSELPVLFDQ